MTRALLALAISLVAVPAWGATAIVEWDNPTQREDGSPLPLSELALIKVFWGSCKADGTLGVVAGQISVPSPNTIVEVQNLPAGTYCFAATAVDTEGLESALSNTASKTYLKSRPKGPRIRSLR